MAWRSSAAGALAIRASAAGPCAAIWPDAPLVVVLHGCTQTAADMITARLVDAGGRSGFCAAVRRTVARQQPQSVFQLVPVPASHPRDRARLNRSARWSTRWCASRPPIGAALRHRPVGRRCHDGVAAGDGARSVRRRGNHRRGRAWHRQWHGRRALIACAAAACPMRRRSLPGCVPQPLPVPLAAPVGLAWQRRQHRRPDKQRNYPCRLGAAMRAVGAVGDDARSAATNAGSGAMPTAAS